MSQVNSSLEVLTHSNRNIHHTLEIGDPEIGPDPKKVPLENGISGGLTGMLENFHIGTNKALQRNRKRLELLCYVILHGLLIGYFSWATYYFLEYSDSTLDTTTCSGYGFLMILFIFINFGIIYYWLIKPFVIPIFNNLLWKPLSKEISKLLTIRFVKLLVYLIIFAAIVIYLIYDTSDNRRRLIPAIGLTLFLIFGFLFSQHPGQINWNLVIWGLLIQFAFGLLTIRWDVGRNIFECLGNKTTIFLGYAMDGSAFVYGDYLVHEIAVFAFQALSTIYFLGFMINILYHYGIMQKIVVTIGEFLQLVMGTTICESSNSAANIFLGMSEAPLLLKPYLSDLTASEIHSVMTSGFATVSGTVLAAYISFGAEASHLITASVMSAPAALCYSKLLVPETEKIVATKESISLTKSEYTSVLDAASKGASLALEVVLGIISNLIAFIAFIFFLNGILSWMGELVGYTGVNVWSVERFVGYIFMPVSYIMGVPWDECEDVGRLIGIKTIINEFAAFKELGKLNLKNKRTKVIATYAICGFSNPGSIGIMISALSVLMPTKRHVVTKLVFRAFIAGEIVCFMTACIAALLIPEKLL
ncbi:hypothetical protein ILUMI_01239 [Ignelater luminosus]|uniref:Sodium/nucleoside cotransporter n=1 Tax=Ignelater luminosus TaxID=2038154 RepID=A0A8K0GMF4_IGNLU|nr:hypothetical protein ILUMI_01239 [Ignelater luminosus]